MISIGKKKKAEASPQMSSSNNTPNSESLDNLNQEATPQPMAESIPQVSLTQEELNALILRNNWQIHLIMEIQKQNEILKGIGKALNNIGQILESSVEE